MIRLIPLFLTGIFGLLIPLTSIAQSYGDVSPTSSQASSSCTKSWELEIAVRDRRSSNRDTLGIAQSSSATDAINSACSESEVPPVPPSPTFGVNFQLPGGTTYSKTDVRGTGETVVWTLMFAGTHPFIFSWASDDLPSGVFRIIDAQDGGVVNQDMTTTNRLTVRDKSITKLLIKRYPTANCTDLSVQKGWNLVSIPVDAPDKRVAALFGSRKIQVYGYSNGYFRAAQLEPGQGYWVKFPKTRTYQICGQPAGNSVTLASGWNLVATHNAHTPVSGISTTPSGIINTSFFGFTSTYVTTDSLKIGKGYWVETDTSGTLTVSDASKHALVHEPKHIKAAVDSQWSVLTIESENNSSQELYLSHRPLTSIEHNDFEMPPRAPGLALDARFATNLQVGTIYGDPTSLLIESGGLPLTVRVDNLPYSSLRLVSLETYKPLTVIIDEQRPATIPAGYGVFSIEQVAKHVSNEAPSKTHLTSTITSYPNPFRSSTVIDFSISYPQHVRIVLFNMLGQEVQTVIDQTIESGSHRVPVSGLHLPAGTYLYRIETSEFITTKTMSRIQ